MTATTPPIDVVTPAPARRVVRLAALVPATVVAQVVTAVVVAGLAASRADDGSLSPTALVGLAVGEAMAVALLAWVGGLYTGAAGVLDDGGRLDCDDDCAAAAGDDLLAAGSLWRTATRLTLLVGLWALAGSGLMAVALDNRPARFAVILAALVGVGAVAAVVADGAARHRGAHMAVRLLAEPPAPVRLRTRAWRQVGLPLAAAQALVNGGAAWLLFHDDTVGDRLAAHGLTRETALADALVVVVILSVLFAGVFAGAWGDIDARLGRVELDDPDVQATTATDPFGVQGIVYVALAGLLLARGVGFLLPSSPTLAQVIVARGAYCGVLVLVFSAVGYVRGALNRVALAGDHAAAALEVDR